LAACLFYILYYGDEAKKEELHAIKTEKTIFKRYYMDTKYIGTWDSISGFPEGIIPGTFPGFIPGVFTINADNSGKILLLGNIVPCTFEYSADGDNEKLKLILPGVGECIFNVEIFNSNLFLSNAAADNTGISAGLPIYALLSPYSRAD
jgi:hypothetical protein